MIQVTKKSNNKQLVAVCVAWADGSTVEPDGKLENHMKSEIKLKTSVQNDIDGVIYVCVCRYSSPCSLSLHLTMVDMLGIRVCVHVATRYRTWKFVSPSSSSSLFTFLFPKANVIFFSLRVEAFDGHLHYLIFILASNFSPAPTLIRYV